MKVSDAVNYYREAGFDVFPLQPGSKHPISGVRIHKADTIAFQYNSNIGVFAGSENNFAVIDADDEQSDRIVSSKLQEMGLSGWTTVVKTPKRGRHHYWLKVINKPEYAQAYYKLGKQVGHGEFRTNRPAYVVGPPSKIAEGEYTFVSGGVTSFHWQPEVAWRDLLWLSPKMALSTYVDPNQDPSQYKPTGVPFVRRPVVLNLLPMISNPDQKGRVQRINYQSGKPIMDWFSTRSEAEAALVTGLIYAGWDYRKVESLFQKVKPAHYAEVPNKTAYLSTTFLSSLNYARAKGAVPKE